MTGIVKSYQKYLTQIAAFLNVSVYVQSADVATRIKSVAKSKGITVKKLLEDVGMGFNAMSNMRTSMPKADNLAKIADYLDCSVDYLLGRTDNPEVNR